MGRIITIARGMGRGGKTIGKMLAKELDIPYYDKEIIRMASDESGINEKIKNTIFNREEIYDGELLEPDHKDFTSDRNLFNQQNSGSCFSYSLDYIENIAYKDR